MRILPILFNTEMVRAILDGRKTVTRRLIKPQPTYSPHGGLTWKGYEYGTDLPLTEKGAAYNFRCAAPFQPGNILYVRETWYKDKYRYMYSANYANDEKFYRGGVEEKVKWHPSIHMPKDAARIFLKVKDVRVERLCDITEAQAKSEGALKCYEVMRPDEEKPVIYKSEDEGGYYVVGFKSVWNSTVKNSDLALYGWDANPWVWVIEFERCDKPGKEVHNGNS